MGQSFLPPRVGCESCLSGPCQGHLLKSKQLCGTPSPTGIRDCVPRAPPPPPTSTLSCGPKAAHWERSGERESPLDPISPCLPGPHPWSSPALSSPSCWETAGPWAWWQGEKCWRTSGGPQSCHLLSARAQRAAEGSVSWNKDSGEGERLGWQRPPMRAQPGTHPDTRAGATPR